MDGQPTNRQSTVGDKKALNIQISEKHIGAVVSTLCACVCLCEVM